MFRTIAVRCFPSLECSQSLWKHSYLTLIFFCFSRLYQILLERKNSSRNRKTELLYITLNLRFPHQWKFQLWCVYSVATQEITIWSWLTGSRVTIWIVWAMIFLIKHEIVVSNTVFRLYLAHDMCTINFDYIRKQFNFFI